MIQVKDISKSYVMGDQTMQVLKGISLEIEDGDFVAIMGPSGSGKSTLMHILGLLDAPTSGSYILNGQQVASLSDDELAVVRRREIGFIFQQFNLLPRIEAWKNVSLPLAYSAKGFNLEAAKELLDQVGLSDRIHHKSNELSGGQQQRVAIARSLINKPRIIFADEPTGNLDSTSEKEILSILRKLNDQGITIILVTHEDEIGEKAKRLIRLRDGAIQSDQRLLPVSARFYPEQELKLHDSFVEESDAQRSSPLAFVQEFWGHVEHGFQSLWANKVRSGLSMLGILIGVAAVVGMLALGSGAKESIQKQMSSLGSNMLVLRSGNPRVGAVAQGSGVRFRINLEDIKVIPEQVAGIKNTSGVLSGRAQVTYLNKNWNTSVTAVSPVYEEMRSLQPIYGRFFTEEENRSRSLVAVIGVSVVKELFGNRSPVGEMIKINRVNFRVVGVLPQKGASGPMDQDDRIVIPVITGMYRFFGKNYVDSVEVEVRQGVDTKVVEQALLEFMNQRYRVPPSAQENAFSVFNMAEIQKAMTSTSNTMSVLLASIAAISLVVGGIGIMNIMLVSVTERTKEIGLRKAVGAKRRDILLQFLAESIVVSLSGGIMGILIGVGISVAISKMIGWPTLISMSSIVLSFGFSVVIGIVFGSYPATKASKLHPIQALRYE